MAAKTFQKLVTVCLVVSGVHVAAGTAHAVSCANNWFQAPAPDAVGVPTNTLIWAYGRFGGASRARLIGPAGEVPTEERFFTVAITLGRGTNFPVLVPETTLDPNTRYAIEYDYTDLAGVVTSERVSFRTGSDEATSAPLTPDLTESEPGAGKGWLGGTSRYVRLSVAHEGILIADSAGALGAIESANDLWLPSDASFNGVALVPNSPVVRWAALGGELWVGLGECLIWPEDAADRQQARFGVLDLAGNFSGWTDPIELELPSTTEAEAIIAADEQAALDEQAAHDAATAANFQRQNTGCALGALTSSSQRIGWCLAALGAALAAVRRSRGGSRPGR